MICWQKNIHRSLQRHFFFICCHHLKSIYSDTLKTVKLLKLINVKIQYSSYNMFYIIGSCTKVLINTNVPMKKKAVGINHKVTHGRRLQKLIDYNIDIGRYIMRDWSLPISCAINHKLENHHSSLKCFFLGGSLF